MKKSLFFLLVFFILLGCTFTLGFIKERERQDSLYRDSTALLMNMQEKFEVFIDSLIFRGIVTTRNLSSRDISQEEYEKIAAPIIKNYDAIYGLNLVNLDGKIIHVYPYKENKITLGKTTQNILGLRESLKRGDEFWLSPPFHLYQNIPGFIVYLPVRVEGRLIGWIASVVSMGRFLKSFAPTEYLKNYNLIIRDNQTRRDYLRTSKMRFPSVRFVQRSVDVKGRTLTFISWPKVPITTFGDWVQNIALSLGLALALSFLYPMYGAQDKRRLQLKEVQGLLRFSTQEATNCAAIVISQLASDEEVPQLPLERIGQHIRYLALMIEQIKVLMRIAQKEETTKFTKLPLEKILKDMAHKFEDQTKAKELRVIMEGDFTGINVLTHRWLLIHGALDSIFFRAVENAIPGGPLTVRCESKKDFHSVRILNTISMALPEHELAMERSLVNAKKVLKLLGGDFLIERLDHEESSTLLLPAGD